jgi:hypothetical protein
MGPVSKKPYQDHTFSLCIPLELDGDVVCPPQDGMPFLIELACEILRIAPPYSTMGGTLFKHISTYP